MRGGLQDFLATLSATVDSQYLLEAALKPCQGLGRLKIKPQLMFFSEMYSL